MRRLLALGVVVAWLQGCAYASLRAADGTTYHALAFGAAHANAGHCDRVSSDITDSTKDTEHREIRDVENPGECAVAIGGHGSPGMWTTIVAGFGALVALFAKAGVF